MRILSTLLLTLIVSLKLSAQAPQGISYQAVAFTTSGNPVVNGNVGIKVSILSNSVSGPVAYAETHTKPTNAQGLFNLNIGQGTPVTGTFASIDWQNGSKFLKVEVDPAGGANYTIIGTNQLMSVPYALYAEKVNYDALPQTIKAKSNTSKVIVIYTNNMAYGFYQNNNNSGYWETQPLSGTPLGAIATDTNIVVYTTTNAYAFYQNNGSSGYWEPQSLSGTPIGAVASNKNIVVYTTTGAYAFYQNNNSSGYWETQSLSGTPQGAVASNDNIVVYTNNTAYAFYQNNGNSGYWEPQSLTGTPKGAIASKSTIMVYTTNTAYGFYQNNGSSGYWEPQSLSGAPVNAVTK